MVGTIELFGDYYSLLDLWRDKNLFELGYFIGKGIINVLFYSFGVVLSLIVWCRKLTADPLATTDEADDTSEGEELFRQLTSDL